jgi:hypothetical protein
MNWFQLALTFLLAAIATASAVALIAAFKPQRRPDLPEPESQDDFRLSMVRWGYLNEKRNDK